jgi:hypothetical protein
VIGKKRKKEKEKEKNRKSFTKKQKKLNEE